MKTRIFCIDKTLNHPTGFILFHRIKLRIIAKLREAAVQPSRVLKQLRCVDAFVTTSVLLMDLQRFSIWQWPPWCSADVWCRCIIYYRPPIAHPVLAVQVRVRLFGLTHG